MTDSTSQTVQIGFIGAGKMASALAAGMLNSEVITSAQLFANDVSKEAAASFSGLTGAMIVESPSEVITRSNVVILAVKPQHISALLDEIQASVSDDVLIISIAAGVTLDSLQTGLQQSGRVIRVMPNTPCLVGAGACGFSSGAKATAEDAQLVEKLLKTVGIVHQVEERLLDAVTGLSGSGPAYAYQFIEALSDGGVRMGIPRSIATSLAAQTLLGAAKMVLETGEHPGALKDAVTSPGGTTIAGLHALENGHFRGTVMNAVEMATRRSEELG